jgi:hypothetical protein
MSGFFARLAARAAGMAPQAAVAPPVAAPMSGQPTDAGSDPFEATAVDGVIPAPSHPAPPPALHTVAPVHSDVVPPAPDPWAGPAVQQPDSDPERDEVAEREHVTAPPKRIAEPRIVAALPTPMPPRERVTPPPATLVVPAVQPPPIVAGEPASPAMRSPESRQEPIRVESGFAAPPALAMSRDTVATAVPLEPPEAIRLPAMPPPAPPRLVIGRMRVDVIPTAPAATPSPVAPAGERRTARGGVSARGSSLHVGLGQM